MASVPMYAIYFMILACSSICYASAEEREVKVPIGDTANLRCNITSTDRSVFWIKEGPQGQELISIDTILLTQVAKYDVLKTGNQLVLTISDVEDQNEGTYRCQVGGWKRAETRVFASFRVVVEEEENGNTIKEIRVRRGGTANLPCNVTGTIGTRAIVWSKDTPNGPLPITIGMFTFTEDADKSVSVNGNRKQWTLTIRNAEDADEGTYKCQADFRRKIRVFASFKLVVEEEEKPNTMIVVERQQGGSATLHCNLKTLTNPLERSKVSWVKIEPQSPVFISIGPLIISTSNKYDLSVTEDMSTLTINDADESDDGAYMCRVQVAQSRLEEKVLGYFEVTVEES